MVSTPRRVRETISTEYEDLLVQITDDGSRTLIGRDSQVAYHSASGALTETKHVYLDNSGVADRMQKRLPTSVLEVGLGTAMGLLVTLDAARMPNTAAGYSITPLDYTALESRWLPSSLIGQLHPWDWTSDATMVDRFLDWRRSLPDVVPDGPHRWTLGDNQTVCVHVGSAENWLPDPGQSFDAIYFDPFAPQHDGELWQPRFLATMHSILRPDGRLVSYCVSRLVRDALSTVGFDVRTVPGPKQGKRDVLIATKSVP